MTVVNPNALPPGLAGYQAAREADEQRQLRQLQMAGALTSLSQAVKHQREQEAFRNEISALGENPSTEAVMQVAGKYTKPEALLELHQRSSERAASRNQQALQFAQDLDLRQQRLDQQRDLALQRTQDEAERRRITEQYNTARLENQQAMGQLNAQLRAMGVELTRSGQQLQLQRFNAEERERRDKAVTGFANELQQNKLPALSASISTANDLLRQYEGDKPIPGFGLVEGSNRVPNAVRSAEANRNRSAIQAVANDLLALYSGMAVTLSESERRTLEEMRGGDFTSSDFKAAWPRVVQRFNTVTGNLRAGQNAEVLREYQSRPGAMSLNPLVPAFGAPRHGAAPGRGGAVQPPPGFTVVP